MSKLEKILLAVIVVLLALALCGLGGCTPNHQARAWGGTETITLPKNAKLENMTWKNDSLWVLTRTMRDGESAETHTFKEYSAWGMWQGSVVVKEQK